MKVDTDRIYLMPLIMGPLFDRDDRPGIVYKEVGNLVLQYRSDTDAARELVPDCYRIDNRPTVTVTFGDYDGVDFMAGGGYRTATFGVSARFDGQEDHIAGQYILVMYEDKTLPIINGRELLGVPKLFADISPVITLPDGKLRCDASLWGHKLFGIELESLKVQNEIVCNDVARLITAHPSLCYKYIPSFDGLPDANYPTIMWTDVKVDQLWLGKEGKVFFGDAGEEDISYGKMVVDSLKSLPVLEVTSASQMRGSFILRNDKCRRLN